MRAWQLIRQALENMRRSRLRTLLTALGVTIASGSIVCMVGFVLGLQNQVETPIRKLGLLNNIEVRPQSPPAAGQQPKPQPSPEQPPQGPASQTPSTSIAPVRPLDDTALQQLEAIEGVDYACPEFRLAEVEVVYGSASQRVQAVGLPREVSLVSFLDELIQAGRFFSLGDQPEAILSEKMARQLGFATSEAAVGQTVQIVAAGLTAKNEGEFAFQRARKDARVSGVIRAPGFASGLGDHVLLLPVDVMRDLPGILAEPQLQRLRSQQAGAPNTYSRVTVRAAQVDQVPRIEQTIRDMGFETHAMVTEVKEMRSFFIFLKLLLASVGTVALVVAGLGILNTQLITVTERKPEIGLYKAIGASDEDIRLMFLTEAGTVGLLGGLGGLLLARLVATLIQWVATLYLTRQGIETPMIVFRFPLWLLSAAVAYSVVASVLSGLYPAQRAARLDPIQALRR